MKHATRRIERQMFWAGHIEAYTASGLSVREYGRQHGLTTASLYGWRQRLVANPPSSSSTPQWIPVTGNAVPTPAGIRLEIGRLTIVLDIHFDTETLRRVLSTVDA